MTRAEFWDNITSWDELKEFCSDWECDYCDDIYDEDGRDERIDEDIGVFGCDYSWYSLRDLLNDIPSGYDYYYRSSVFDWEEADDEMFERYKSSVCEWADNGDVWDEEDEEDDDFFAEESEDAPVEDEDFSVGDLIGMCGAVYATINEDRIQSIHELDRAFDELISDIPNVIE